MKKFFAVGIFLFIVTYVYPQEIRNVSFFTDYSMPMEKLLKVTKIDAVGGGLSVSFKVYGDFDVNLSAGYQLFSLQQDSALAKWNWDFWEIRYKNRIVADLQADPRLAATINPVQKMDLYPLYLSVSHNFDLPFNLKIIPKIGGGVMFFRRRMYLEEVWQKKFDEYFTYEYSYRNFASDKTGNPYFVTAGLRIDYGIASDVCITAGSDFRYILKTPGKFGYDQFVFNDLLSFNLGITFVY